MAEASGARPTWAEVDLEALQSNYQTIRSQLEDGVQLMAVLKADAYGHGAVRCAQALEAIGADWFGVALPEEGRALRQVGITRPIFCVGGFWQGQGEQIIADRIVPAIFRRDALEELDAQARVAGRIVEYHLKIDTGMGRLGILEDDLPSWLEILPAFPNIQLTGALTHFADADAEDPGTTQQQVARFQRVVEQIESATGRIRWQHLANSAGVFRFPAAQGTLARAGATLYGLVGDVLAPSIAPLAAERLRPVLSLHTRIILLKWVPAGQPLGYGGTYRTQRVSRIATLPIGYADGLRRALSNRGHVLIRGCRAPIVGRVSMDLTLVDVTDIPGVTLGDEVILLGRQVHFPSASPIRAEELAAEIGTISYEVVTGIGPRVPRHYSELPPLSPSIS
ncbi:MAG: alanine racemase [Blastocatellia bacterium]